MPKYDPPYLKRPLVNPAAAAAAAAAGQMGTGPKPAGTANSIGGGAGPSGLPGPSGNQPQHHHHPTANHSGAAGPSSTPIAADALSLEAGAKGISFGAVPAFRYASSTFSRPFPRFITLAQYLSM